MLFEWDERKAVDNYAKHGVTFEYATRVFLDERGIIVDDERKNYGEPRHNVFGMIEGRYGAKCVG